MGSDDFSGHRTSPQSRCRFVPRRAILLALDDRVCASAPRNSYPRALGRLNHQLRAKCILEDLYPNTRPKKKSRRSSGGVPQPPPTGGDASGSSESG